MLIVGWIISVRTQCFANGYIKNATYDGYIFQCSNHACLTPVHIFSSSYFVTCSTPPKWRDSAHGRYFRSPPAHSSTVWTASPRLEIRLKLRLVQRVCMAYLAASRTIGLEHGWECKSSQLFPLHFSWMWNHHGPFERKQLRAIWTMVGPIFFLGFEVSFFTFFVFNLTRVSIDCKIACNTLLVTLKLQFQMRSGVYWSRRPPESGRLAVWRRYREQRWCSCESTRLPPMWSEFESWTRRHTWVEFVGGSPSCSESFSPGSPVSSLQKNQHSKF